MPSRCAVNEFEVIERYETLETTKAVAEEFEISDETVRRILIRHEIPRTHRHNKEKKYTRQSNCKTSICPALVVMLRTVSMLRASDIANAIECKLSAVTNVISKRGLQAKKPKRREELPIEEIESRYISGEDCYSLGREYGVSHETISKWMRSLGHHRGKGYSLNKIVYRRSCQMCGRSFGSKVYGAKYCDRCRRHRANRTGYISRARLYGVEYDSSISLHSAIEMLGLTCAICGGECDPSDKKENHVGASYPTIDHIVPMCKGGSHTWENIQIAHHICNSIKRDRDVVTIQEVINAKEQASSY